MRFEPRLYNVKPQPATHRAFVKISIHNRTTKKKNRILWCGVERCGRFYEHPCPLGSSIINSSFSGIEAKWWWASFVRICFCFRNRIWDLLRNFHTFRNLNWLLGLGLIFKSRDHSNVLFWVFQLSSWSVLLSFFLD